MLSVQKTLLKKLSTCRVKGSRSIFCAVSRIGKTRSKRVTQRKGCKIIKRNIFTENETQHIQTKPILTKKETSDRKQLQLLQNISHILHGKITVYLY